MSIKWEKYIRLRDFVYTMIDLKLCSDITAGEALKSLLIDMTSSNARK